MKNTTVQALVAFGVIMIILMVVAAYYFMSDPYSPRENSVVLQSATTTVTSTQSTTDTSASSTIAGEVAGGFALSSAQVEALVSLGIDPADVPSSISAEQEECFVEALGEDRVEEIKAGAVPNALEFMRARSCI